MMTVFGSVAGFAFATATIAIFSDAEASPSTRRAIKLGWLVYAIVFGPFVVRGYFEALMT